MKDNIINDWNPETASLFATLAAHGFAIEGGNNGEDDHFKRSDFANEKDFLRELLACDEATLFISRSGRKTWLALVMGNSPGELVSDYGVPSDGGDATALDEATTEHYNKWEGRKQPKTTAGEAYPQSYK